MDSKERDRIIESTRRLKERETAPASFDDPYSDMTPDEKSKLIMELVSTNRRLMSRLDSMDNLARVVEENNRLIASLQSRLYESRRESKEKDALIANLQKRIADLLDARQVSRKERFGSKSHKGKSSSAAARTEEENKNDFDGTPGSIGGQEAPAEDPVESGKPKESEPRPYRMGMKYRTMKADSQVVHHSDASRLPAGSVVVDKEFRYTYEQETRVTEHKYELITYRTPDGVLHTGYFPAEGEPDIIDVVPGTHASSNLLAHLAYNRFVMDTPVYREIDRLMAEKMNVCRMTITNWLEKGGRHLSLMIEHLKDLCMERDSIVNCDETWCRVKVGDKYRKKYMWCLVNREARTAIFYYDEGSRSRDTLKRIIGGREMAALQSDGYNVYMYIDKELQDCEHLCCNAHSMAKFKYAAEISGDPMAGKFLKILGRFYSLEDEYKKAGLTAEQIGICRQNEETKALVIELRSLLNVAMAPDHPPRGELMEKAVNYLHTFWDRLMAFLKDGRYSIDNSIAEQHIRPLAGERKNSLFFGSGKMASISAAYHTIISTCKMQGISALEYLKTFFREIVRGRRDYENLLPSTIGLTCINKH